MHNFGKASIVFYLVKNKVDKMLTREFFIFPTFCNSSKAYGRQVKRKQKLKLQFITQNNW